MPVKRAQRGLALCFYREAFLRWGQGHPHIFQSGSGQRISEYQHGLRTIPGKSRLDSERSILRVTPRPRDRGGRSLNTPVQHQVELLRIQPHLTEGNRPSTAQADAAGKIQPRPCKVGNCIVGDQRHGCVKTGIQRPALIACIGKIDPATAIDDAQRLDRNAVDRSRSAQANGRRCQFGRQAKPGAGSGKSDVELVGRKAVAFVNQPAHDRAVRKSLIRHRITGQYSAKLHVQRHNYTTIGVAPKTLLPDVDQLRGAKDSSLSFYRVVDHQIA